MTRQIVVEATTGIGIAATVLTAGVVVGAGAFFGGYLLGESQPDPAPTELAEKTYTVADLEQALNACQLEDAVVEGASVTLHGGDHSPARRQCFVAEMGAPELADREYTGAFGVKMASEGDYSWSNVHMVWKQTDEGRDVTITVE